MAGGEAPAVYYPEVALHPNRLVRLQRQHGINQIANGPDTVCDAQRNRWRGPQRLMDPANPQEPSDIRRSRPALDQA